MELIKRVCFSIYDRLKNSLKEFVFILVCLRLHRIKHIKKIILIWFKPKDYNCNFIIILCVSNFAGPKIMSDLWCQRSQSVDVFTCRMFVCGMWRVCG